MKLTKFTHLICIRCFIFLFIAIFSCRIAVAAVTNTKPTIKGTPQLKVKVGTPFSFIPTASDVDGDPLTFSIANKPAWLTFNTATGALTGTPTAADVGITALPYLISVSDGKGGTARLAAFNISVQAVISGADGAINAPPVISGVPGLKVKAGEVFSFVPTASDANNDPLTFSITNKPAWAAFDPASGKLSGTPALADTGLTPAGYVIKVSDGNGGSASLAAFNIEVFSDQPIPNRPPVISGTSATTAKTAQTYSFTPTASDPDNNPLSFSIVNKPAWATFDTATGKLSGIPALTDVGAFNNIGIQVSDGKGGTAALPPFNVTVSALNVANAFGIASQGAAYVANDPGMAAAMAIDGLDSTRNHTACNVTQDWWQVQLPKPTLISKIVVRNLDSGWTSRLNGATVYVTDQAYSGVPADSAKVATLTGTTADQVTSFTPPKSGTYVIIKAANGNCLHMREVEVYGEMPQTPSADTSPRSYLLAHGTVSGTKVDTYPAVDYQLDPITYAIQGNVPFAVDDKGNLSVTATLPPAMTYTFNVSVSDGTNSILIPITVKTTALDALAVALRTGDATNVTDQEILDAAVTKTQADYDYCISELTKIYPTGNLQTVNFPTQSAYMTSETSRNVPLHVNAATPTPQVYSWMGKKENNTPYAVLGTGVFNRTPINTDLKDGTLNLLRWLMGRDVADNILAEPLVILAPISGVRSGLNDWLTVNNLPKNWIITGDTSLLTTGKFDLFVGDMDSNLAQVQSVFALNKPVLLYNYWYQPPDALLAEFDLKWTWYNSATIGGLSTVTNQCQKAFTGIAFRNFFVNLKNGLPDFIYEASDCTVSAAGNWNCATDQVSDAAGKNAGGAALGNTVNMLFMDSLSALRSIIRSYDKNGINLFSQSSNKDELKLAVLLGDKYRAIEHYPIDKVATDDNTFFHAFYADYLIHYARPNNYTQPDLGKFSQNQLLLNAKPGITKTVTLMPTANSEWTSTGVLIPPGKTVTIRRTDTGAAKVMLRSNFFRETTQKWEPNGYNRPLYLASNDMSLDVGKTYTFSSPYGGPAYLNWDAMATNPAPFTVEFTNVLDNPLLEQFDAASIQAYVTAMDTSDSEWVDLKTPFAEIHSKKSHMYAAFDQQDGTVGNGFTTQDVLDYVSEINNYLILGNYALAGYNGVGLPALKPGVLDFCDRQGLSSVLYNGATTNLCTDSRIHLKPKIQHINAEINAACGSLCSGNPFDTGSPVSQRGWGENHEMGHNLQVGRLKIYGRTGEVSNNIYPIHTITQWAIDHGLSSSPSDNDRPTNQTAFTMLQNAIKAGTAASINHPLWASKASPYDNAFERLAFYVQVAYVSQSWDVYTKLMLMDRIYGDALGSTAKWDAVKNMLGFGNYVLDDTKGTSLNAKNITASDFMYIALSVIEQRNYSDYFTAWGVEQTQAARDQVAANGITDRVPARYYYVTPNVLPLVMPTFADTIPLDGVSAYTDPTP